MSLTSAPVVPCSCAEGWKPEGWTYCNECYEGQLERLRSELDQARGMVERLRTILSDHKSVEWRVLTEARSVLFPSTDGERT